MNKVTFTAIFPQNTARKFRHITLFSVSPERKAAENFCTTITRDTVKITTHIRKMKKAFLRRCLHIAYKVPGYKFQLRSFYFLTWHTHIPCLLVYQHATIDTSPLQTKFCFRPIESDCFKLLMVNELKIISTYFYIVNCFKQNVHSRKKHTFYV